MPYSQARIAFYTQLAHQYILWYVYSRWNLFGRYTPARLTVKSYLLHDDKMACLDALAEK